MRKLYRAHNLFKLILSLQKKYNRNTKNLASGQKVLKVKIEDVFLGRIVSIETGHVNTCILLIMI